MVTRASIHVLYFLNDLFHLFGLMIKLTQSVRVNDMCLGHKIDARLLVLVLKEYQAEGKLALCSQHILRSKLNLKEYQNVLEMLLCFFIMNAINLGVVIVVHPSKIFLSNELTPDLDDL